jgi:membrane protein DedA with SNARE-associated domain
VIHYIYDCNHQTDEEKGSKVQIQELANWMQMLALQYGYLGVFAISLIGALSLFVPIPYTVVIFTIGGLKINGQWAFEPVWVAVAAGLGASLGEFSGYVVGFGGRRVIGAKMKRKMDVLVKLFDKHGSLVIFLFALTPLPDDLLFIPLGVVRYNVVIAFVPAIICKFCMNLMIVYGGRYSIEAIRNLFGVEGDWISAIIGIVLAVGLLIIVLIVMFKLDWEKYVEKFIEKRDGGGT